MSDIKINSVEEGPYVPSSTEAEESKKSQPENGPRKSDTLFLYSTVISGTMPFVLLGVFVVWTSPVIPKLLSNTTSDNPLGRPATTLDISLIAGIPTFGTVLGPIVLGSLPELIGRKNSLHLMTAVAMTSIVILAYSTSVFLMVLSRFSSAFMLYGFISTFPVYLTEICEDHNRAKYGCMMNAFTPLGSLLGYIVGSILSVRYFTLVTLTPLIFYLFFCFFAPESPEYSLSRNRTEECVRAINKLRSNKTQKEIQLDLQRIEETIKASPKSKGNVLYLFNSKEKRYALLLALGPIMVQYLSGVTIILQFVGPIFEATGTKYNSDNMASIVGLVKLITFTLTSFVVEKTGRRPLLLISAMGTGIPLFILGLFFYLKHLDSPFILHLQWLPLTCVILFVILYSIGLGPIPIAIVGELFTPNVRASAVSFVMTFGGIIYFITSITYPSMVETLGMQWCIWMYSFFNFLGAIFIFVMLPETKGKSIVQIQEYIKTRCNK